jgi:hypothetical protein
MKSKRQLPNRRLLGLVLLAASAILLSGRSQTVNAQWATSGNNIYYNAGTVGIGTTSPTDLLHLSSASGVNIRMTDATNSVSSYLTQFSQWSVWAINRNPLTGTKPDAGRTAAQIYFSAMSGDSSIHFFTSATNGADPTERMVIDKSGNVGIGTITPSASLLHLQSASHTYVRIGAPLGYQSGVAFNDDANGQDIVLFRPGNTRDFSIWTATSNEVLRVTQSGNVGIGTTTPNRKLELVQDVGGISFEAGTGSPNSGVIRFGDNTG